jgi:O-antigen ligase
MNRKLVVLLCLTLCFGAVSQAYAYLDPGIGTYTFQILIAGFMAAAFTFSRWWSRLRGFFSKGSANSGKNGDPDCAELTAGSDSERGPQI